MPQHLTPAQQQRNWEFEHLQGGYRFLSRYTKDAWHEARAQDFQDAAVNLRYARLARLQEVLNREMCALAYQI